jgi:membrane protease YdiL (CAAX protease family)
VHSYFAFTWRQGTTPLYFAVDAGWRSSVLWQGMRPPLQDPGEDLPSALSFGAAMAFEASLLLVALGWGWLFRQSALADLHWSLPAFLLGAAAFLPPFALFLWTLRSKLRLLKRHRDLMNELIERVFRSWSLLQLLLISLCAGFSEEALFRGAVQASLTVRIGPVLSLVLASLLFGASHLITWTYGLLAASIGLYLGLLYLWTGNLLVPMTAHAVYDFVALIWLTRARQALPP